MVAPRLPPPDQMMVRPFKYDQASQRVAIAVRAFVEGHGYIRILLPPPGLLVVHACTSLSVRLPWFLRTEKTTNVSELFREPGSL